MIMTTTTITKKRTITIKTLVKAMIITTTITKRMTIMIITLLKAMIMTRTKIT